MSSPSPTVFSMAWECPYGKNANRTGKLSTRGLNENEHTGPWKVPPGMKAEVNISGRGFDTRRLHQFACFASPAIQEEKP